ncbi:hypothetical protein [Chlamydia trachomatis]|nr:hypothetical protein [Chlamydia trachomatis]UYF98323.1 hypothetical protein ODL24_00460 [Chlamydia trachomatis]
MLWNLRDRARGESKRAKAYDNYLLKLVCPWIQLGILTGKSLKDSCNLHLLITVLG